VIFRTLAVLVWIVASSGVFLTPAMVKAGDGLAPEGDLPRARQDVAGIDEKLNTQLPLDLVLRDEQEKPITLRECIDGKPTILVPMYYRCPMLCNLVLKSLVETLRAMPQDFSAGGKFNVVAVSFDWKEHCDLGSAKKNVVLQEYGREGAEHGWRFLTGSKEAVAELMATIGYRYEFDKSFKEYNHPSGIIILTPEGKIARYFYGISYDGEFRVPGGTTTLRLSLVEAADGKGGTMLDKLTLLCYRFEHMKGYSLNILRTVQIGGIITLVVVGIWLFLTFRHEWRGAQGQPTPTDGRPESRDSQAGGPPAPQQTIDGLPSGGSA
jgi:protein SCO1